MLGGLLLWAGHFLSLYAIGSLWPGSALATWLILVSTLGFAAGLGWLLLGTLARQRQAQDPFDRWMGRSAILAAAAGGVGIVFQGLTIAF